MAEKVLWLELAVGVLIRERVHPDDCAVTQLLIGAFKPMITGASDFDKERFGNLCKSMRHEDSLARAVAAVSVFDPESIPYWLSHVVDQIILNPRAPERHITGGVRGLFLAGADLPRLEDDPYKEVYEKWMTTVIPRLVCAHATAYGRLFGPYYDCAWNLKECQVFQSNLAVAVARCLDGSHDKRRGMVKGIGTNLQPSLKHNTLYSVGQCIVRQLAFSHLSRLPTREYVDFLAGMSVNP